MRFRCIILRFRCICMHVLALQMHIYVFLDVFDAYLCVSMCFICVLASYLGAFVLYLGSPLDKVLSFARAEHVEKMRQLLLDHGANESEEKLKRWLTRQRANPEKGCPLYLLFSEPPQPSLVPAVLHAAGAFLPGKSAILDWCALCNMPQAFFSPERGDPGFLRPVQHAAGALLPEKR